jgi:DNA-binding transcriptional regulator YdaS (Cro superfamily)
MANPFEVAIEEKGLAVIAAGCGVSPQAVHKWKKNGIPAERVLEVERITGVPRHKLRSDIYPAPGEAAA